MTVEELRDLVQQVSGSDELITDLCDSDGNYLTVASAVSIFQPLGDKLSICINKTGQYDELCKGL